MKDAMIDPDDTLKIRDVLDSAPDALIVSNAAGEIVLVNALTERLFGYTRDELMGRSIEILVPSRHRGLHADQRTDFFRNARRRQMGDGPELSAVRKDGTEFPVEINLSPLQTARGTFAVAAIRDISKRRQMESDLAHERVMRAHASEIARETRKRSQLMLHLAQHDMLTSLPNRALIKDRIDRAIARARRYSGRLAILFLDVDRFKHINDSLGHTIGDKLLQSIAQRLVGCVRNSDTTSRQGGDEFVVLLSEVTHPEDAAVSAKKLLAAMARPHRIDEHELHVAASIGISIYPDDGADAEVLIRNADIAMYHAKEHGHGYDFFKNEMHVQAVERHSLEARLRAAVEHGEFELHYQPIVNLQTGTMTGGEALIRWRHPDRRIVPPMQFMPVAEECGLIVPIGQWVLREACRQAQAWQDAGLRPVSVSVNISALEFKHRDFLEGLRSILKETRLEPSYLELELTETILMDNAATTSVVLRALKAMGVRLAVDDFGTGYSSLSYLSRLPIDALKIDQSFVHEITTSWGTAPIITAMITMGKSLRQRVIAEGVESNEELKFLQEQHCGEGQGHYFSEPLVAERFAEFLAPRVSGTSLLPGHDPG